MHVSSCFLLLFLLPTKTKMMTMISSSNPTPIPIIVYLQKKKVWRMMNNTWQMTDKRLHSKCKKQLFFSSKFPKIDFWHRNFLIWHNEQKQNIKGINSKLKVCQGHGVTFCFKSHGFGLLTFIIEKWEY